ncbi:hypothetical protein F4809DRAFT_600347 [Biscogniauxia mediterranea]|nr:hypothetical protein F4809DRAFT_600347 [Biscogniauxia mediterranea]
MAEWPNGKASDYESEDCGFESHLGHSFFLNPILIKEFSTRFFFPFVLFYPS